MQAPLLESLVAPAIRPTDSVPLNNPVPDAPRTTPAALGSGAPVGIRPTRVQEWIRQWILLIPLVTAVAGSATIQSLPTDQFADLMPPIFFVGALIVTTAMLHQRHLLTSNFALTDELQDAHERLDTLHHLALELSTSLNVAQVAQAVLDHTLQLTGATAGALWLKTAVFPPAELEDLLVLESFDAAPTGLSALATAPPSQRSWRLFAARGFSGFQNSTHRSALREWLQIVESEIGDDEATRDADATGSSITKKPSAANLVWAPIWWKGHICGAIFVEQRQGTIAPGADVLLEDIALVAGPALQNALLYQSAAERAEVDGLTRLLNHRAIQERLQQEVARVERARLSIPDARLAIAVMDVTDFKLFNDTYGHAVGDQVLRSVSDCLKKTFRISDIVGRFGGDEFLVLLPDTPCHGSETLCSRAVAAVASQPFLAPDGSPITVRLTCGVASFPEDGMTSTQLLKTADERLYAAKRKGQTIVEGARPNRSIEVLTLRPEWSSIGLLDTLVATIDAKDHYTRAQSERAWRYALMIAHQLGFSSEQMHAMHWCALTHDVGKIVVPDAILRKPGRLTEAEFLVMQQHTIFGAMIVKDLPELDTIIGAVRHHHEHWDGSGYPDRLAGEEIPIAARILAVADSFGAMISPRPYRHAHPEMQAFKEIERHKGTQYDPAIVEAFGVALRAFNADASALQQILIAHDAGHLCRNEVVSRATPRREIETFAHALN
jgi:diguanylate cyclase (GGDEF)-like protein